MDLLAANDTTSLDVAAAMSELPVKRCLWCDTQKPVSLLLPMCCECWEREREKVVREKELASSLFTALRQRDALMKLSKAQDCLLACYRTDANPGRMSHAIDRVERCRTEVRRWFDESQMGEPRTCPGSGGEDTEGNPPHRT